MTFQIEGIPELSAHDHINERHDESCYEGNDGGNSVEWLNLSLGRHGDIAGGSKSGFQSKHAPSKIFSCNFRRRKFCSSQAVGGRQNAHKRERVVRRYQSGRLTAMTGLPVYKPMARSLGVQPHSLVRELCMEWRPVVGRFNDSKKEIVRAWTESIDRETTLKWPGSYHVDSQPSKPSPELLTIDWVLRL